MRTPSRLPACASTNGPRRFGISTRVALRGAQPDGDDLVGVGDDVPRADELDAAQLRVLVAGLDETRDARVALEVR